jgi:hypothetical protein
MIWITPVAGGGALHSEAARLAQAARLPQCPCDRRPRHFGRLPLPAGLVVLESIGAPVDDVGSASETSR